MSGDHIGFAVRGKPLFSDDIVEDRFEVPEAARECARLLDAQGGWTQIQCGELRKHHPSIWETHTETFIEMEWRIHVVDGGTQKRKAA